LQPLDSYVETPLVRMEVVGDPLEVPDVQREVIALAEEAEGKPVAVGSLERFAFYERARSAYAVVASGERRAYGCVLLSKGVLIG
jgi:L-fucose mutarotase